MVRLDVAYVFGTTGGPALLWKALQAEWPTTTLRYATVQMWQQRGSISRPWQMPVLYVMAKQFGVSPLVCLVDDEDLAETPPPPATSANT